MNKEKLEGGAHSKGAPPPASFHHCYFFILVFPLYILVRLVFIIGSMRLKRMGFTI